MAQRTLGEATPVTDDEWVKAHGEFECEAINSRCMGIAQVISIHEHDNYVLVSGRHCAPS